MKILLTNDDGIEGEGLIALALALQKRGHSLLAIAPDRNNSAVSHRLTMREELTLTEARIGEIPAYALSGTPADCVLFGLRCLGFAPDVVLSGINDGMNLGSDCLYSGTVAGAEEGAQNGVPSIACSLRSLPAQREAGRAGNDPKAFSSAAGLICDNLVEWTSLARQIEGPLNVNVPAGAEPKGFRFCPLARLRYRGSYLKTGENTYRMSEFPPDPSFQEGTDEDFCAKGYVTITPLKLNNTDYGAIARWESRT